MERMLIVRVTLVLATVGAAGVLPGTAAAAQHAEPSNAAGDRQLAGDGSAYVAFPHRGRVRIYRTDGRVVRQLPLNEQLLDLSRGSALVGDGDGRDAEILDIATGRSVSLRPDVEVQELGRYWVLGRVSLTPDPSEVRAPDHQWVFVNRRTGAVEPASEPYTVIGIGDPPPPSRGHLDTPDHSLPADPSWIPATNTVIARRGQQAIGYAATDQRYAPLELYRSHAAPLRLSACPAACASADLGGGVATWLEPIGGQPANAPRVKVWNGHAVRTLRAANLRGATVVDVAQTRSRVFVAAIPAGAKDAVLRSYRVP